MKHPKTLMSSKMATWCVKRSECFTAAADGNEAFRRHCWKAWRRMKTQRGRSRKMLTMQKVKKTVEFGLSRRQLVYSKVVEFVDPHTPKLGGRVEELTRRRRRKENPINNDPPMNFAIHSKYIYIFLCTCKNQYNGSYLLHFHSP